MKQQFNKKHVSPILRSQSTVHNFPNSCPLDLSHDYFNVHNENKNKIRYKQWKCLICNKTFVSEKYLNDHFDRKHEQQIPMVKKEINKIK